MLAGEQVVAVNAPGGSDGLGLSFGLAVDISRNPWLADNSRNTVVEILKSAAPVVPLAQRVQSNTRAARP
jgi:hypothetical protein